jgi:hypothetical protein
LSIPTFKLLSGVNELFVPLATQPVCVESAVNVSEIAWEDGVGNTTGVGVGRMVGVVVTIGEGVRVAARAWVRAFGAFVCRVAGLVGSLTGAHAMSAIASIKNKVMLDQTDRGAFKGLMVRWTGSPRQIDMPLFSS